MINEVYLVVCLKTLVLMVFLFIAFSVMGKRATAQLNVYDLVTLIALANAVQNGMTMGKGEIWIGISAASTLILVSWLLGHFFLRHKAVERTLIGVPTVLVNNGHLKRPTIRRECVTEDELMASIRSRGLSGIKEVRLAVLEVDGSISVVPYRKDPAAKVAEDSTPG